MARTKQPGTETGTLKDKAVMVRDEPAKSGTLKDKAVMVRDEPAKPGTLKNKTVAGGNKK